MARSTNTDAPVWGTTSALDAFASLMWRLDDFPGLCAAVMDIEVLEHMPEWPVVTATHRALVDAVPRLRQRPTESRFGVGKLHWTDVPEFSLDHHLKRVPLPLPGTHRQLLDFAQQLAMEPFDAQRAPWQAVVVENLEGGAAAYILKLHHALSDGKGIVQLLSHMHQPLASTAKRRRSRMARSTADAPTSPPTHQPLPPTAKLARYLASTRRVLAPYTAAPSPLLAKRSFNWHFETMVLPFADLHNAAKAAGASLNDAFIAGVLGGFRRYHARYGVVPAALPIAMPISIRDSGTPGGGNHFAAGIFAAPLAEPDPVERMRWIGAKVAQWRAEPALVLPLKLMNLLAYVPPHVAARAMLDRLSRQDLQLSNVPGIRAPITLAGARVMALYPFAPLPGCAGMIAMVSHEANCCFGLNLDDAAIAEPAKLMEDIHDGFAEIFALAKLSKARHAH